MADIKVHHLISFLNTASGKKQIILVLLLVSYLGKTKRVCLHITPGLTLSIVGEVNLKTAARTYENRYKLNPDLERRLAQIIAEFPCSIKKWIM